MDTLEIIDRLEELIKNNNLNTTKNSNDAKDKTSEDPFKEFVNLILLFFLNILKTPFKLVAKYVTNELLKAVKRDSKLYVFIIGLLVIMFVFFSVLWLFIAVVVGVYFYDHGHPVFTSILYSIVFQLISFIVIVILAYISIKSIKSLKLLVEISKNLGKNFG